MKLRGEVAVEVTETDQGRLWHKVRAGSYPTPEAAQDAARDLKKDMKLDILIVETTAPPS